MKKLFSLPKAGALIISVLLTYTGSAQSQGLGSSREESINQLKSILAVTGKNPELELATPIDQPNPSDIEKEIEWQSKLYATDVGVDISEAKQRLKRQDRLGKVIELLEDINRERFAGAWIEHQPEYRVVVRLVGKEPVDLWMKSMVIDGAVPVVFKTQARFTQKELLEAIDLVLPELMEALPALSGTDVDVKTGEIVLTVGNDGVTDYSLNRLRSLLAKSPSIHVKKFLSLPIRFEQLDAPVSDGHTRGGANLSTCTSGFVVKDSNGVRGYITAGHCGNSQTYYEFGGTSYATTFIDEIRDADQDVQWHTTPHLEYPHFYASSTSSYRTLTSRTTRSSQSVGGYVCHRGKTTGYSCGYIDTKTYKPTYTNACNGVTCSSVWVKVSGPSLECYPGDSGGPWFLVYSAYGIYKGQSSSGTTASGCNWAFYMASDYFGISLVY